LFSISEKKAALAFLAILSILRVWAIAVVELWDYLAMMGVDVDVAGLAAVDVVVVVEVVVDVVVDVDFGGILAKDAKTD